MYKPLRYGSLFALIQEFDKSYKGYYHRLIDVNLGLPFSHNHVSETPLQWKLMRLSFETDKESDCLDAITRYCKDCLVIISYYEATGGYPQWCDETYRSGHI
jgi:hypothetical protein